MVIDTTQDALVRRAAQAAQTDYKAPVRDDWLRIYAVSEEGALLVQEPYASIAPTG